MWIWDTLKTLTEDLRGKNCKLIIGYLFLSVLFLLYIYGGKRSFLNRGTGYGIPAAIAESVESAKKNHKKLSALLRQQKSYKKYNIHSTDSAALQKRIAEARKKVYTTHLRRQSQLNYLKYCGWFLSGFFFLFLVPFLFIYFHPGLSPGDFGLGLGNWKLSLRVFAIFAAMMLIAVFVLLLFQVRGFLRYYPMYAKGGAGSRSLTVGWFVLLELCYLLYFVGWEFYFRSLLILPLEKSMGALAPLVGALPFAIMHIDKPVAEAFGSIVAAYFLGVLVLKTRSFWICAVLHFIIAFAMDLVAVLHRGLI